MDYEYSDTDSDDSQSESQSMSETQIKPINIETGEEDIYVYSNQSSSPSICINKNHHSINNSSNKSTNKSTYKKNDSSYYDEEKLHMPRTQPLNSNNNLQLVPNVPPGFSNDHLFHQRLQKLEIQISDIQQKLETQNTTVFNFDWILNFEDLQTLLNCNKNVIFYSQIFTVNDIPFQLSCSPKFEYSLSKKTKNAPSDMCSLYLTMLSNEYDEYQPSFILYTKTSVFKTIANIKNRYSTNEPKNSPAKADHLFFHTPHFVQSMKRSALWMPYSIFCSDLRKYNSVTFSLQAQILKRDFPTENLFMGNVISNTYENNILKVLQKHFQNNTQFNIAWKIKNMQKLKNAKVCCCLYSNQLFYDCWFLKYFPVGYDFRSENLFDFDIDLLYVPDCIHSIVCAIELRLEIEQGKRWKWKGWHTFMAHTKYCNWGYGTLYSEELMSAVKDGVSISMECRINIVDIVYFCELNDGRVNDRIMKYKKIIKQQKIDNEQTLREIIQHFEKKNSENICYDNSSSNVLSENQNISNRYATNIEVSADGNNDGCYQPSKDEMCIRKWCSKILHFQWYSKLFIEHGFNDIAKIRNMNDEQLMEIGISAQKERLRIMSMMKYLN